MMSDAIDYQALLSQLESEREKLDTMIAWVRGKLGQQAPDYAVRGKTPKLHSKAIEATAMPRQLASDTFFRMQIPVAIKSYLNIMRGPRSAKLIVEGLKQGGLTSKAKNLYQTVYPSLLRMEKAGEVVRVTNGEWGLVEWYPAGTRKSSPAASAADESEDASKG
jgi:hypothetical protein